jgi:hypothetical protein
VAFSIRYFGRPTGANFGGDFTVGNGYSASKVVAEANALRQTNYSDPDQNKRLGINFLVPITSPDDPIMGVDSGAAYNAGHNYGDEACNRVIAAINDSSGVIKLPVFTNHWYSKQGLFGPIVHLYLDVEPDQALSWSFWAGFSDAVYWKYFQGYYPFYPCAYVWDDSPYAQPCGVLGAASSGPNQCHGVFSAYHLGCNCRVIRNWQPNGCAGVVTGGKLWQTATVAQWDCSNQPCGYLPGSNFDLDISVPTEGDSELFYMLYVEAYGPSDTPYSIYPAAIRGLSAFNILRTDPGRPTDNAVRAEMAAFICRAVSSGLTSGPSVVRTWDQEDWTWDPSTNFWDIGGVDPQLQRNIRTLKHYGVSTGYPDGSFNPLGDVLQAQVISFISRAWVARGRWANQPIPGNLYGGALSGSGAEQDVATYVAYCGPVPGTTSTTQYWSSWNQPAQRQWFSEAEWRALGWMNI